VHRGVDAIDPKRPSGAIFPAASNIGSRKDWDFTGVLKDGMMAHDDPDDIEKQIIQIAKKAAAQAAKEKWSDRVWTKGLVSRLGELGKEQTYSVFRSGQGGMVVRSSLAKENRWTPDRSTLSS